MNRRSGSPYGLASAALTAPHKGSVLDRRTGVNFRPALTDGACDHYSRCARMSSSWPGLAWRRIAFSIAWARVQPDGRGALNAWGVAFYRGLAETLLAHGIEAAPLYPSHFPAGLQDRGGWASPATLERFAEYGAAVASQLGDVISAWITVNEPWGSRSTATPMARRRRGCVTCSSPYGFRIISWSRTAS